MEYRRFGRTELAMPVLSCGGMRYQYQWQDVSPEEVPAAHQRNVEEIIETAWAAGITHIETARAYGSSEMQIAPAIARLPREKLILQTKVVPKEGIAAFRDRFHQSLSYLQQDYVDLLGIHGINTPEICEEVLRPGGYLEEAQRWRDQGKVRFIGFSTHGPTAVIEQAIRSGAFDYVNLHWYWIFQDNWPAIAAATEQDMGVFIISPSDKGGHLYNPSPRLRELCDPLSPIVFNDLFCLSHPQIHTLSIGASRPTDFTEHLNVLPLLHQDKTLLPPILERLEARAIAVLGEDWCRTWRRGLPRPQDTPGEMNIPVMLWLYNLVKAYDMVDFAKARYNLLGNGGHWFPGQRFDGDLAIDWRSLLRHSPHGDRIPQMLREVDAILRGDARKRLTV